MQLNSGSDRENRNGRQRSKSRRLINVQLYLATLLHRAFIAGNTAASSFHCRQLSFTVTFFWDRERFAQRDRKFACVSTTPRFSLRIAKKRTTCACLEASLCWMFRHNVLRVWYKPVFLNLFVFDELMHPIYLKGKPRWKAIWKSSCEETITPQYYIKHTTKARKQYLMAFSLFCVINQQLGWPVGSFGKELASQLFRSSIPRRLFPWARNVALSSWANAATACGGPKLRLRFAQLRAVSRCCIVFACQRLTMPRMPWFMCRDCARLSAMNKACKRGGKPPYARRRTINSNRGINFSIAPLVNGCV